MPPVDWELVVVGDGPARPEVEAAFAPFPPEQVRLVGFQAASSVAAWLRASDVYVWPAIDEAFGMAFIEAQACAPLRPAASRRSFALSVISHRNSGSSRPKWP